MRIFARSSSLSRPNISSNSFRVIAAPPFYVQNDHSRMSTGMTLMPAYISI
nr:MAG TPA: hypothetical protein [Caudoviricetes sp.]